MMLLWGGMKHVFAAAVTSIVKNNIHNYTASNWYVTQVQTQKHIKQTPKTSCKVLPNLK